MILRIATWNCQHGKPDPDRMGAAAASLDVDVLAVQEVDRRSSRVGGRDLAADAAEAFGGELVWAPALTLSSGRAGRSRLLSARRSSDAVSPGLRLRAQPQGGEYGNALLVRGRVLRSTTLGLPGRRRVEPRVAAIAEVEAAGRTWTIAATHLTTRRDISPDQLLALIDALRDWPAPRVLLGDLNLEAGELLPWLTAESYRMALGPLTHSVRRLRRQIDHVAVNGRGCTVRACEARALPVGDHLALIAEVHTPE